MNHPIVDTSTSASMTRRRLVVGFCIAISLVFSPAVRDVTLAQASAPVLTTAGTALVAKAVEAGWYYTCAITVPGDVLCWGDNRAGQVNPDSTQPRFLQPTKVAGLTGPVKQLALGYDKSCALLEIGTVWCWGNMLVDHTLPTQLVSLTTTIRSISASPNVCAVSVANDVTCTYGLTGTYALAGLANNISEVASGNHACGVTTSGAARCTGTNDHGQLGNGSTSPVYTTSVQVMGLESGVAHIAVAPWGHSCAVMTDGNAMCWGQGTSGELGAGPPTAPPWQATDSSVPRTVVKSISESFELVKAGYHFNCALVVGGAVKCWGYAGYGKLGTGAYGNMDSPQTVPLETAASSFTTGFEHACAVLSNGAVRCWGSNTNGQLGNGFADPLESRQWLLDLGPHNKDVSAGGQHTCLVKEDGSVRCWGLNSWTRLGTGQYDHLEVLPPITPVGLTSGIKRVFAAQEYTCAINESNQLLCWGYNGYGYLYPGQNYSYSPVIVAAAGSDVATLGTGFTHMCSLSTTGVVRCWGRNGSGQVGNNTTVDQQSPVELTVLGAGNRAIAAGSDFSCVLTAAGGIKCWGTNTYGQLGDGSTLQRSTPVDVQGMTADVVAIGVSQQHACGILASGQVKCWGRNLYNALGNGGAVDSAVPVAVVGVRPGAIALAAGSCVLLSSGDVQCWGGYPTAPVRDVRGPIPLTTIGADRSSSQVCGLDAVGYAHCWGGNTYGEAGKPSGFLINPVQAFGPNAVPPPDDIQIRLTSDATPMDIQAAGSTVAITLTISTSGPSILLANTAAATNTIDVVVPVPNNTLYVSGTVTGGGQPITDTNGTVKQLWWRVPVPAIGAPFVSSFRLETTQADAVVMVTFIADANNGAISSRTDVQINAITTFLPSLRR